VGDQEKKSFQALKKIGVRSGEGEEGETGNLGLSAESAEKRGLYKRGAMNKVGFRFGSAP